MKIESTQWNPGHWSEGKRKMFPKHMRKYCWLEMCNMIGSYKAGLLMAEINRDLGELGSVEKLGNLRIKTIGEVEALDLLHAVK